MGMAWDSARPLPLRRMVREWLIYVGIASAALVIYYVVQGKDIDITLFAGLLASGPMYLIFGSVLAKFGYQRKTLKDLRADREMVGAARTSASSTTASSSGAGIRSKPAPTRRTSTGPSQHRKPKRR
jgi:hypothetical protein